jgi:SAM-dependent methyltransferase
MSTIFRDIDIDNWEKKSLSTVLGICGFFPAYVNYLFIGSSRKILIIGDSGGRDYNFIKKFDKTITVFDITMQSNVELKDQIIGDANIKLPFKSKSFDAVVAFEVIEHLKNDAHFLLEIRRILKDDGIFSISVPFLNDYRDFHIRIHTDLTIKRLLVVHGFKIEDFIYRGAFLFLNNLIGFLDGIFIKIAHLLLKKNPVIMRLMINELFTKNILIPIGRTKAGKFLSKYVRSYYGGFIKATKSDFFDINKTNIIEFRR